MVHAWSFVLLFFHAHAVQVEGSHGQLGPHALMMAPPQPVVVEAKPEEAAQVESEEAAQVEPEQAAGK